MPVAPTPPTKPTPPVAPVLTPANSNTTPDPTAASPVSLSPTANKAVSPEVSGAVKKLEGLGQAFQQGKATPVKDSEKVEPATTAAGKTTNNNVAVPPSSLYSQNGSQTTVPAKQPVIDSKPSSAGYYYFSFLGIVGVIVVIMVGLRLFKEKTKPQRTLIDYSERAATTTTKEGIDVVVAPQTTTPKVKSNFEVRV